MEKPKQDTLESIDLEKMDKVSGGCARCTGGAAAAATGAGDQGGLAQAQQLGSTGARRG